MCGRGLRHSSSRSYEPCVCAGLQLRPTESRFGGRGELNAKTDALSATAPPVLGLESLRHYNEAAPAPVPAGLANPAPARPCGGRWPFAPVLADGQSLQSMCTTLPP